MPKELFDNICQPSLFERLYNSYAKELHQYLYYRYGETLGPKDKVQEAFIKLWENCMNVTQKNARAYLYKVANNMMLNAAKHQKVVLKYEQKKPKEYTHESPEFLLEQEQYLEQYQKALAQLSEEQRVAFLLNKIEGKKHEEIAEILGVTRKVVEYRIYSAFNLLKKELHGFKIK